MIKKATIYEQLTALPYLSTYQQLIQGAIKLDLFSHLETPKTVGDLSRKMNWNEYNTLNLLKGLYSLGYIKRQGDTFCNMPETSNYLVKGKPAYMGEVLTFFCNNQGMNLGDVVQQVKEGPKPMEQTQQTMDFASFGEAMRKAQSGIRQHELLEIVRTLPENKSIRKVLDLGCGAGCFGIAIVQDAPERKGVLFDLPSMQKLIEETVKISEMQENITVKTGDFLKDEIGSDYDLILCSSIMFLGLAEDAGFFKKLKDALNPGGLVLCLNEGIEPDYSGPWDMILGYMAFNLQGMPMGVIKGQIADTAKTAGFNSIENRGVLLSTGTYDINILRVKS